MKAFVKSLQAAKRDSKERKSQVPRSTGVKVFIWAIASSVMGPECRKIEVEKQGLRKVNWGVFELWQSPGGGLMEICLSRTTCYMGVGWERRNLCQRLPDVLLFASFFLNSKSELLAACHVQIFSYSKPSFILHNLFCLYSLP